MKDCSTCVRLLFLIVVCLATTAEAQQSDLPASIVPTLGWLRFTPVPSEDRFGTLAEYIFDVADDQTSAVVLHADMNALSCKNPAVLWYNANPDDSAEEWVDREAQWT